MEIWKVISLFEIGWVILTVLWAYGHYRKIEVKKFSPGSPLDYALRVWLACMFAGVKMLTLSNGSPEYSIGTLTDIVGDLIVRAGSFWLVFDLGLNILRPGKEWNYISMSNKKFLDRIFIRPVKGYFLVDVGTDEVQFVKTRNGVHSVYRPNWVLQYIVKLLVILIGVIVYYAI